MCHRPSNTEIAQESRAVCGGPKNFYNIFVPCAGGGGLEKINIALFRRLGEYTVFVSLPLHHATDTLNSTKKLINLNLNYGNRD